MIWHRNERIREREIGPKRDVRKMITEAANYLVLNSLPNIHLSSFELSLTSIGFSFTSVLCSQVSLVSLSPLSFVHVYVSHLYVT
jgi:hypothetical protein